MSDEEIEDFKAKQVNELISITCNHPKTDEQEIFFTKLVAEIFNVGWAEGCYRLNLIKNTQSS